MIARLHDMQNHFIVETKAVYRPDDKVVYLTAGEDLSDKGPDFLVHYSDDVQGVHDLRCTWTGQEQEDDMYYIALSVEEIVKNVQRRMDVKAKINLPIRLALLQQDNTAQTDPETGRSLQIRGYLRDISAGGVMIETEHKMEAGQKFAFPFDKGSEPVLLNAEVIREQEGSGSFNSYGCKFYDSNNTKDAAVREYVFRLNLATRPNHFD